MIWCPVLAQIATVWLIKSSIKRMNWFMPPAHARAHTLRTIKRKTADGIKIKFQAFQTRKTVPALQCNYLSFIKIIVTQMCFYSLRENHLILFGFFITISCVFSSSSGGGGGRSSSHRFIVWFWDFFSFFFLPNRNLLPNKRSFSRRFHRETGLQPVCDPRGGARA